MKQPDACPKGAVAFLTDVHPDEWTSEHDENVDLYRSLEEDPVEGMWAVRGNEHTLYTNRAAGTNKRFTDVNLNYTTGRTQNAHVEAYEVQRAPLVRTALEPARVVIEPHGNRGEVPYVFYTPDAPNIIRGITSYLGIQHAVHTPPGPLGYGKDNHLLVDIPPSWRDHYVPELRCLGKLLGDGYEPVPEPVREYVYCGEVTTEQAFGAGLEEEYPSFEPLPRQMDDKLTQLGFPPGCVFMTWSYKLYGFTGYIGEVCRPVLI